MEKKIILNKSLKSPLSSTSKDDLFLLLTIDDTKIVWLIKSVLPSNQSIDEFWKLIEIIIPFGVKIKGVMVNSADNISVSSVFLLNHRYKILRKIFSDALYFISFSMESDEEGEYHAKILKDSMMIENDKSKLIDDYSIEFDDNDDYSIYRSCVNIILAITNKASIVKNRNLIMLYLITLQNITSLLSKINFDTDDSELVNNKFFSILYNLMKQKKNIKTEEHFIEYIILFKYYLRIMLLLSYKSDQNSFFLLNLVKNYTMIEEY